MPIFENANDIYILSSYLAGAVILISLAWASYATRVRDKKTLRRLESQMREFSEKQEP